MELFVDGFCALGDFVRCVVSYREGVLTIIRVLLNSFEPALHNLLVLVRHVLSLPLRRTILNSHADMCLLDIALEELDLYIVRGVSLVGDVCRFVLALISSLQS